MLDLYAAPQAADDDAFFYAYRAVEDLARHYGGGGEGQKAWVSGFFLPTDDDRLKEEILEGMSALPSHVMVSALDAHILSWDGAGAVAAVKVPALYVAAAIPVTDIERMRQLCPQLVVGQTVGSGHFNNRVVPEQ